MAQKQTILFLRGASTYENYAAAKAALDALTHKVAQPVVALYSDNSATKAILAIGKTEGTGSTAYEIIATNADLAAALASITETSGALDTHKTQVATDSVLGHIKSGGDITVSAQGIVTVNDLDKKAPIDSPTFTGTPKSVTPTTGDSSTNIATTAFVAAEIASKLTAAQAMTFKGILTASAGLPESANAGDTYFVGNGFTSKVGEETVEVGDMVICTKGGDSPEFSVVQKNIDGAVVGAASSVEGNIATFKGATGKTIQDSGVAVADLATKATKVQAGDGLKGGGALTGDVTVSHQDKPTTGTKTGETGKYVSAVTVDDLGHVASVETADLPTESGKVKVTSAGTADYMGNQFGSATASDNEVAVAFSTESNKVVGKVTINTIDGGTF